MNIKPTSLPGITIADQPTEEELRALKTQGYIGVVNLRHDGEPEQPLSTSEEGKKIQAMGLDYLHYGVGGGPLTAEGVASVCEFLDSHASGKVLVHCRRGARARPWCSSMRHWRRSGGPTRQSRTGTRWVWRSTADCGCSSSSISRRIQEPEDDRAVRVLITACPRGRHLRRVASPRARQSTADRADSYACDAEDALCRADPIGLRQI